jgi:hypothetical protein
MASQMASSEFGAHAERWDNKRFTTPRDRFRNATNPNAIGSVERISRSSPYHGEARGNDAARWSRSRADDVSGTTRD